MAPSIFARLKDQDEAQQAPPPTLAPSVFAGMDESPMGKMVAAQPEPAPVFAPSAAPRVALAPQPMTPEQQNISSDQQRLEKVRWNQDNPWGTANNHPGVMGKVAHAFSTLGNIAGDIFAPAVTANIPGSQLNMQEKEAGLTKRLNEEVGDQSKNAYQGASAAHLNAETNEIENPSPEQAAEQKPFTLSTDQGMLQWDGQHWSPIEVNGQTVNQPEKIGATPNMQRTPGADAKGNPTFGNYHPDKGIYTDQEGNVIPGFKPANKAMQGALGQYAPVRLLTSLMQMAYKENPALLTAIKPLAEKIMSQYGGSGAADIMSSVPQGQPQNDAGAPIGTSMPEAPTGATRSRGQFAESVLPSIESAHTQIKNLGEKLGPMAGRYNELATSQIGAYGPEFAGLQTTLHNIATAWMRLHANSDAARQDFVNQLKAAQNPENLEAVLDSIDEQAKNYTKQGKGRGGQNPNTAAPRPANVPEGYVLRDGPKGKGWYAPTK